MSEALPFLADLTSFLWGDERRFEIKSSECKTTECSDERLIYQADINELFGE